MKLKLRILSTVVLFSTVTLFGQVEQGFTVGVGTHIVSSGGVTIDYSGGGWTNDGTITSTDGTLGFSGPVAYSGLARPILKI
jgi:hypothetical protein